MLGFEDDARTFAFAGEILKQLGVAEVRLMTNNPKKIAALAATGLTVASHHRIPGRRNDPADGVLPSTGRETWLESLATIGKAYDKPHQILTRREAP